MRPEINKYCIVQIIILPLLFFGAYSDIIQGSYFRPDPYPPQVALPIVFTSDIFDIRGNTARGGGSIIDDGGNSITSQGLCWSTKPNPTTANSTTDSFERAMDGLSPNTLYYVRAYAVNSSGTGYGNQVSFNSGFLIGSIYGGGIVFHNDGKGHGLVCAPMDQSTGAEWGCYGTLIGETSPNINTGATNTAAILNKCPKESLAAHICNDLELNTYSDWYLPSKVELNLMYVNLHTLKLGGFASYYYWSSSEYNSSYVCIQYFLNGRQCNDYKNYTYRVRATRSF